MVFSSAIFLWIFLPLVFCVNYFIQPKYSNYFLLIASLIFYAWGEPVLVILMILSIIINWLIGIGISKYTQRRNIILFLGVVLNLLALAYYKYAIFLGDIINNIAKKDIVNLPVIVLPIGISFFTFQAISYIVDVYRGETEAQNKLVNTALYISFFPQLIAGPIVKYREINQQIETRNISTENIAIGFRRFIYGLSKKILISNSLGKTADMIFSLEVTSIGGKVAWVGALFYFFQIYYDFSGYSDMAIGLGKMFGFDFLENFNYPYISKSIGEFWRRWHISLGSWFKEYVYIPLGGNRKGAKRTYINLFTVFFLTGLWHGASFSFILWGLYHGFFSILEKKGLIKILEKSDFFSRIYLFTVVIFGWVIFRIEKLKDALLYIKRMLMPWQYTDFDKSIWYYMNRSTIFVFIVAFLGMGLIQKALPKKVMERWRFSATEAVFCTAMLILCLASAASNTYNPFIYFQF